MNYKEFIAKQNDKLEESFTVKDHTGKTVHTAYTSSEAKKKAEELTSKTGNKHTAGFERTATVKEAEELEEGVEISHDRFVRSHGKKAKDAGPTRWMFTHKRMGDVNRKDDSEFHEAPHGSFADAKKSASAWAKKHGHSTAYVMEEVEQIEEETIHVGYTNSRGIWIKTSTHKNVKDANAAMKELEKAGKKGVQKRYDYNGSIDPGAMMTYTRESEQIEELSQDTIKSYKKKAWASMGKALKSGNNPEGIKTTSKRLDGLNRTKQRTEEVERIEELSKDTLASYHSKAIGDRHSKDLARVTANRQGEHEKALKLGTKVYNRSVGLEKAKDKFFKEETEVEEGIKRPTTADRFHIVKPDSDRPANLASYPSLETAKAARDKDHPGAKIHQVGPKGAVKKIHEEVEIEEGYVVHYHNAKGEKQDGNSKVFKDETSAKKHADRGNKVDKVGGKYVVKRINDKGHVTEAKKKKECGTPLENAHDDDYKEKKMDEQMKSPFDWKGYIEQSKKQKGVKSTGDTKTGHEVKKISTGTVYTKKANKDGEYSSHDEKKAAGEEPVKRGRGRPAGSYGSYKARSDETNAAAKAKAAASKAANRAKLKEAFDEEFVASLFEDFTEEQEFLDFEDLMQCEEFEQLDELSKGTLKSYFVKAATDRYDTLRKAKRKDKKGQDIKPEIDREAKRLDGMTKSQRRLAKEEVELEEADKLALRGLHTANPQSIPDYRRSTEAGKKSLAKKNTPDLKGAIKSALGKHTKPVLPEEVEHISEEQWETMSDDDFDDLIENFEQLDELSKGTLKSYVRKAATGTKGAVRYGFDSGRKLALGDDEGTEKDFRKANNRSKGIVKAVDRLTKEEVEQIEELYKDPDKHFSKQSKPMQDAINLHQRKGKSYWEAVRAAKSHVKEEVESLDENVTKVAAFKSKDRDGNQHNFNVYKNAKTGNHYHMVVNPATKNSHGASTVIDDKGKGHAGAEAHAKEVVALVAKGKHKEALDHLNKQSYSKFSVHEEFESQEVEQQLDESINKYANFLARTKK
jgi:hypothetical protein